MKAKLGKNATIAIVALLIFSVLPISILPVQAGANGDIYVDPDKIYYDTVNGTICTHFNITIRVRDITVPVFAWQVCVFFRTCYINVTQWWEPTWDPEYVFYGRGTLPVPTPPDPGYTPGDPPDYSDSSCVSSALFPANPPGFTGDGILAIIEFHICNVPGKGEVFECDLSIDNAGTFLLDEPGAEIPEINKQNGYYRMTWAAPPPPYQKIQPIDPGYGDQVTVTGTTITFDSYHVWNCTDFDVEVLIMSYDAAWGMTNATVWVDFNSTMLDIIGGVANVTIGPDWAGPNAVSIVHGDPDYVIITVRGFTGGSGDVLVATIRFHIIGQGTKPLLPEVFDESVLSINCTIWDHTAEIPQDPSVPGLVRVGRYILVPAMPWLEVQPSLVEMGPEPCLGEIFCVDIVVKNLHPASEMIAYQFRLLYDPHILSNVSITEGPFLTDPRWNWYGTLFISDWRLDGGYGPHAIAAGILMPNPVTGEWDMPPPQAPGPDVPDLDPPVDPVLATICFDVKKQVYPENLIVELELTDFDDHLGYFLNEDGEYIPSKTPENGTVIIYGDYMPGRMIDVYTQWPCGRNGRGLHMPSDMFCPQKLVILCAEVTYNYWPVQQKIVGFEIQDPNDYIWAKLTAVTDEDGIACVEFRMPWPCEDPESLFGEWTVTATVDLACTVVNDTLTFKYDYCVRFHKVIIEGGVQEEGKWFKHCQWVKITVAIKTYAMRMLRFLVVVVIKDELGVPIGIAMRSGWIGGAEYCTYEFRILTLWIHVPKFAAAGEATIHVNLFDKDPTEGGFAYCPEYEPTPIIYIQPY